MKTKLIASIVLTAALLVTANVRADLVTIYAGDKNKDDYMSQAGSSEWGFGNLGLGNAKAGTTDYFDIINLMDPYRTEQGLDLVGDLEKAGGFTIGKFNGSGNGYNTNLQQTTDLGVSFGHNSSNSISVGIPDELISSFFMTVGTHANKNSTQGTFNITFYGADGEKRTFNDVALGFAGFIFDEGYYLTRFEVTINGNPNSGVFVQDFTPGNGKTTTPEPATLAIIGLGLAGLGLAKARRRK